MTLKDFIETLMNCYDLDWIGATNYIRVIQHTSVYTEICPIHPYHLEPESILSINNNNERSFILDYIKTISRISKKFDINEEYASYLCNSVESITAESIEFRNTRPIPVMVIIVTDKKSNTRDSDSNFKDALKHIICKSIDDEYLKTLIIKTWEE